MKLTDCVRCPLHRTRHLIVPGMGSLTASMVIVGEGPGNEEDLSGRPFVGAAGKLLTRLLKDVGIEREDVYITNTVKCRPPDNRNPTTAEMRSCRPYLENELESISPRVVVALGRVAAQNLTKCFGNISDLQAKNDLVTAITEQEIPTVVCYHPSYLLRALRGGRPEAKRVYENFKQQLTLAKALSEGWVPPEEEKIDLSWLD